MSLKKLALALFAKNASSGTSEAVHKTNDSRHALHVETQHAQPLTQAQLTSAGLATQATLASVLGQLDITLSALRVELVGVKGGNGLTIASTSNRFPVSSAADGTWGYASGISGTVTLSGSKRVLQITAIAAEAAATITINGGNTITLPYGATDKVSSAITIEPRGNLVDPEIVFTGTKAYFVEHVS